MRLVALLVALCLVVTCATAAVPANTRKSAKSRHHSAGKVSSTSRTGKSSTSRTSRSRSARRGSQQKPTPERYQEIQQALASRGYYSGPVNGAWNDDSVAALKRFQTDQNLPPDGKLSSLSLIAMGLGPKRSTPLPHSSTTPPATSGAPDATQSNPVPPPQEPAGAH